MTGPEIVIVAIAAVMFGVAWLLWGAIIRLDERRDATRRQAEEAPLADPEVLFDRWIDGDWVDVISEKRWIDGDWVDVIRRDCQRRHPSTPPADWSVVDEWLDQ